MGDENRCTVWIDDRSEERKVLLETDALIMRGRPTVTIPFSEMKGVVADGDDLSFSWQDRAVRIALGQHASRWAKKITNPKTRAEKLGIRRGASVAVVGVPDPELLKELHDAGAVDVGERRDEVDLLFFAVESEADLATLPKLRQRLASSGGIWVIRRKGGAGVSEQAVMNAARNAGLVDVKVARYSDTHTAEKLVIPVAKR